MAAVVRLVIDHMKPRGRPRERNLWVVVDEHVADNQALVFRHNDSPNELMAKVTLDPFVFFKDAVPVGVQRRRANAHVDTSIEHCFRALNGPGDWHKIAVETRSVVNRVNSFALIRRIVVANSEILSIPESDYIEVWMSLSPRVMEAELEISKHTVLIQKYQHSRRRWFVGLFYRISVRARSPD